MEKSKTGLIVALDVDNLSKAEEFIDLLYPEVEIFKIGSQLFTLYGPEVVKMVHKKGAKVFLDLKFHDIPNTVANAAIAATRLNVFMFNVHAQGGLEMMKRTKEAAEVEANKLGAKPPLIIGVTVLTSTSENSTIKPLVATLTEDVDKAGLDGVVASVKEAGFIRSNFGSKFIIVTPGIRLKNATNDDQKRIATPLDAVEAGANYIVVGRPILNSSKPKETAKLILAQLN
ncbi:MAG TPA: orotidine-5'-phosphate decarboxylase [Candidatus Omnitrophica bacterium]|nr:orotidine-5'-phosphate decarboxylase [Candidatus Omnitrophota bacterium]